MHHLSSVVIQEAELPAPEDLDSSGRRPKRKAAVSATKSLKAARDSPDSLPSDDEYKGGSDEAEGAMSGDDDMGSVDEDVDEAEDEEL